MKETSYNVHLPLYFSINNFKFHFLYILLDLPYSIKMSILSFYSKIKIQCFLVCAAISKVFLAAKKLIAMHVMRVTNMYEVLHGVCRLLGQVQPKGVKNKKWLRLQKKWLRHCDLMGITRVSDNGRCCAQGNND